MGSGDVISQFVVERKSLHQYDASRTTRFFLFGTVLLVCVLFVKLPVVTVKLASDDR